MELDAARAVVLRHGEGETIFDLPERTIRILADRVGLALTWFRYEAGQEGPEPHVHRRHTDAFYILEGELEFGLGPDVNRTTGTAGTFVAAPPNVVHTFRNGSDATVVFLNIHAPSMGFARMLRAARDGRHEDAEEFDQFEPPADGGRPLSDAVFRGVGEGDSMTVGVSNALLKLDQPCAVTEWTYAPGFEGPIVNRDRAGVSSLYVLEGALSLQLADEEIEAASGALVLLPAGNATLANRTAKDVRVLSVIAAG